MKEEFSQKRLNYISLMRFEHKLLINSWDYENVVEYLANKKPDRKWTNLKCFLWKLL